MDNDTNLKFNPNRIRQIREYRKINQVQLAQQLGLSQSSYNDLEQGHTKLKVDNLPKLATMLKVDIRCFFETGTDYRMATDLSDEFNLLENRYNSLLNENERLNELLLEKQQLFLAYQMNCEERFAMKRKILSGKRFFIKVLLLVSTVLVYVLIFVLYFDNILLWFLS